MCKTDFCVICVPQRIKKKTHTHTTKTTMFLNMFEKRQNLAKYCAIIGAHLICTPFMFLWTYGNLYAYMDSYFNFFCYPECKDTDPQWIFSAYKGNSSMGLLLLGLLSRWLGIKTIGLATMVTICMCLLGASSTIGKSVIITTVVMGCFQAICAAVTMGIAVNYIYKWMPEKLSVLTASASGFPALLSVAVNQIIQIYVNPDNLKPDALIGVKTYFSQPEILNRVPGVLILLAVLIATMQLVGYLMLTDPAAPSEPEKVGSNGEANEAGYEFACNAVHGSSASKDIKSQAEERSSLTASKDVKQYSFPSQNGHGHNTDGAVSECYNIQGRGADGKRIQRIDYASSEAQSFEIDAQACIPHSWTPKEVLRTYVMWSAWGCSLSFNTGILILTSYYKQFGFLYIPDDRFLTVISSLFPFVSTFSRVVYGTLMDKGILSVKDVMVLTLSVNSILYVFLTSCAQTDKYLYMFAILGLSSAHGAFYVILPTIAIKIFGPKHFATNYGMMSSASILAGYSTALFITPLVQSLGWFGLFSLCGTISTVSLILIALTSFNING